MREFHPGDLVYFWRSQESGQGRTKPGAKGGRFLGPARVLATETRRGDDGSSRPGSAVWCVRGRQLIKCCPEQLRAASEREELLEALTKDHGQEPTPWTFTKLATEIAGTQYQDVSGDKPTDNEWWRAQDPQAEAPPTRYRIRTKRASPESVDDMEIFSDDAATPATSSKGPRRGPLPPPDSTSFTQAVPWQKQVPEAAWVVEESAYWNTEQAAVAVEVDMPGSEKQWDKALHNLSGYFVGALRRQAAEVSERRLTEAERLQFREAKMTEVRNFVAAQAFEALPSHLKPSADQAISMRWILTWKVKEDGSRKAKARAVLLGYQDPQYEHRGTTAPVMTKLTRQMLLQAAANHKWSVFKGDVSGAFLQGRDYPDTLYCIPTDEICTALGLKPGSITRLRRACYDLVDAPLEWYRTVADFLQSLGLERLWSDACAWAYRKDGALQGLISGHVDDFLFTGNTQDARWNWIIDQIKTRFKWGDWDCDHFTQCGVNITKTEDGFILSQEKQSS